MRIARDRPLLSRLLLLDRRLYRLRRGFRLGLGLRLSRRLGAFRPAADIDHGAVTALHFRIHPTQDQHAAVECNHFAVLRAGGLAFRADIGLVAGRAFQAQFLSLGLVGEMHHYSASGAERDDIGLLALTGGGDLDARAVFVLVVGGQPPAADDILWREGRWH